MTAPPITPEDRAARAARIMWDDDPASQQMGMALEETGPGRAVLSMTVRPEHCNGHGTCHGGMIFALADSAFAFACNSYNQRTVAQHCTISYIAPGRAGDRLRATAREISRQGRSGIYDVAVANQTGTVIAEFRGFSRTIQGQFFEETDA